MKTYTHQEWLDEGRQLFGANSMEWKFCCPSCKTIQTGQNFIERGIEREKVSGRVGFSCIGRIDESVGCKWTLGGLLQIHEAEVVVGEKEKVPVFLFATPQEISEASQ